MILRNYSYFKFGTSNNLETLPAETMNLLVLLLLGVAGAIKKTEKPNIIIMYMDDMGWGDIGAHG